MVVGAGRGPLVRRALVAASQAERSIKVYAVEKNPNAVLTLHAWKEMEWGDKVIRSLVFIVNLTCVCFSFFLVCIKLHLYSVRREIASSVFF